jgi:hypothetical protein
LQRTFGEPLGRHRVIFSASAGSYATRQGKPF